MKDFSSATSSRVGTSYDELCLFGLIADDGSRSIATQSRTNAAGIDVRWRKKKDNKEQKRE